MGVTSQGEKVALHGLWNRRHTTKFNGVSYPVQRAAEAAFSPAGQKQVRTLIHFYLTYAPLTREGLSEIGVQVYGGVNAPYVWVKTPGTETSWDFFDRL